MGRVKASTKSRAADFTKKTETPEIPYIPKNATENRAGGTRKIIREQKKEENKKRIIENSDFVHTPERSPKKRRKTYLRNPS